MNASTKKPLVIVTGPHRRWRFSWWATRLMLRLAGLRGFYVTPQTRRIPAEARGVIIGGGNDIDPTNYGILGDAGSEYDPERDRMEMEMVRSALDKDIPLLGICRGAQLINVVLGGSLYTDIRPCRQKTPNHNSLFPVKWVDLAEGSRLQTLVKAKALKVNSLHNQAINRVAQELRVVARDRDEFVQAVEASNPQRCIFGVQWHPEYMPYNSNQRELFRGFAAAVRRQQQELGSSESPANPLGANP